MTADELRDEMLSVFRGLARYWANLPDVDRATGIPLTIEDRCDGVVFSILAQLDGVGALPSFDLVSHVHPDDDDQSLEGLVISDMLHECYSTLANRISTNAQGETG
jgi:hypothetical protein